MAWPKLRAKLMRAVSYRLIHRTDWRFGNYISCNLCAMRLATKFSVIVLFGVAAEIAVLALSGPITW